MTQYSDPGESGVVPVIDVVVHVAQLLPRSNRIFQDPVDVSGNYYNIIISLHDSESAVAKLN